MCEAQGIKEKSTALQHATWIAHLMNATGNFVENPVTPQYLVGGEDRKQEKDKEQREMKARAEKRRADRLKARKDKYSGG